MPSSRPWSRSRAWRWAVPTIASRIPTEKRLATRTTSPKVIDARGTLNTDQWLEAGWITRTLGRP
ncbi:hypothetical protein [Streptomyces goshikiensis]|uniref:hypothetical protein n=1 Tax=Streptomyces goshikiensis TaxID=1942 RepID=UPI0033B3472E